MNDAQHQIHHHYHYFYYYPYSMPAGADGGNLAEATPNLAEPDGNPKDEPTAGDLTEATPDLTEAEASLSESDETADRSMVGESYLPTDYIPHGVEILTKDRGILSSYGYYHVRDQTQKHRRMVLAEATQYISKDYIQERLYYIAMVQPTNLPNPYAEDLKWFERTYHLRPIESVA